MSSTKQYVLSTKKQIDQVKKHDTKAKRLTADLKAQGNEIRQIYSQLQQVGNLSNDQSQSTETRQQYVEAFNILNRNMEQAVELNKVTQQEYNEYMGRKFQSFKNRYSSLFERLIEGDLDAGTLNHVLDTISLVEHGHLDMKQGRDRGLDYLTNKFDLPSDFFNKNKVFLDE